MVQDANTVDYSWLIVFTQHQLRLLALRSCLLVLVVANYPTFYDNTGAVEQNARSGESTPVA